MTEDALAGDREIVMILPEKGPTAEPVPVRRIGTLGTIHNERRLPTGEYLFDLIGTSRVRIVEELTTVKLYRQACVETLRDSTPSGSRTALELAMSEILRHLAIALPTDHSAVQQYLKHLSENCRPGEFSDLVAYTVPLSIELKQQLLEEHRVDRRLDLLVETAHAALKSSHTSGFGEYPPSFGRN